MATEYSRAACQVAVAQIAEAAGFDTMQQSSLDILSDLLQRYIGEIGRSAHCYAETCSRGTPSAEDLVMALKDMGVDAQDIANYTRAQAEEPFAHVLPPYPMQRTPKWPPSFQQKGEEPPKHIPAWLPALPDRHTYVATPSFAGHDTDAKRQRLAATKAKRQALKALVRLSERAGEIPSTEVTPAGASANGAGGAAGEAVGNPFLAAPSWEDASAAAGAANAAVMVGEGGVADAVAAAAGLTSAARPVGDSSAAVPDTAGVSLADTFAAAASSQPDKGFWQEAAPLDGVSPSIPGEGGGGGSGAASFSQQWGPSVVAAAGSGPSRLKELLPFFREQEDSFAEVEKAQASRAAEERLKSGRKAAAKARSGHQLPAAVPISRAHHILAAGHDAVVICGENDGGGRAAGSDDD